MAEGAPDQAGRQDATSPSDQKPPGTSDDADEPQVGDRPSEGRADGEDQHPEDVDTIPAPGQVRDLAGVSPVARSGWPGGSGRDLGSRS
jgi:hypothetical protein